MEINKNKSENMTIKKKMILFFRLNGMKLLAIITVICGIFGSYIYYGYQIQSVRGLRLIMVTLFSTFKLYMASPTVALTEETNILYEIARLLAPIYTAAAIVQTMKKVSLNIYNRAKHINHSKIYVFGYNDASVAFMNNVVSKTKSKKIIYLNNYKSENKITDSERLNLLTKGIVIHDGNFTNCNGLEEKRIQFNKLHIKKDDVFVFMNEDVSQNFIFLVELKEYLMDKHHLRGLKCRVMCDEFGIRNLIADLADGCQEYMDINTFDIAEIAINDLIQNPEHLLYDAKRNGEHFDSHILILGFGRIGEEVLVQAVNNCVTSADNQIVFDVFDKNMSDRKEVFLRRFAPDEISIIEDAQNNISIVSIGNVDEAQSKLCIRFHIGDIRTRNFEIDLKKICSSITYAAICFEDAELSLMSMVTLRRYLNYKVPLAVRMDMDSKIIQYIRKFSKGYGNIFPFCISREIFTYESIVGEMLDIKARKANELYEKYASEIYGHSENKDNWLQLSMLMKNSNRMQIAHTVTKRELLKTNYYKSTCKKLQKGILTELKEVIKEQNQLQTYIGNNERLFELAQVEHRRWSYFHILKGFRHVTKKELEFLMEEYQQKCSLDERAVINKKTECRETFKVHDLIIPWKQLISNEVNGAPQTAVYDLIPLIMAVENMAESDSYLVG